MNETRLRIEWGQPVARGPLGSPRPDPGHASSFGDRWSLRSRSERGLAEYQGRARNRSYNRQVFRTVAPLLVCDLLAVATALWGAVGLGSLSPLATWGFVPIVIAAVSVGLLLGLGRWPFTRRPGWHPMFEIRDGLVSLSLVFVFVGATIGWAWGPRPVMYFLTLLMFSFPLFRIVVRRRLVRRPDWGIRCLVFGGDRRIEKLYEGHRANLINGLRPVGFLQDRLPVDVSSSLRDAWQGRDRDATGAAMERQAFCALVHRRGRSDAEILEFIESCLGLFCRVIVLPDDHRLPSHWNLAGRSALSLNDRLLQPGSQLLKRVFDVGICLTLAPVCLLLVIGLGLAIRATSGSPVFVGAWRMGRYRQRFRAWTFRTLDPRREGEFHQLLASRPELRRAWEDGAELPEDPRWIPLGRWLRRTGLHELPMLWNVLRGEMSLVGPRLSSFERLPDHHPCPPALRVAPGLTGIWRIADPYFDSSDRRRELDACYVRNWSLWLDVSILLHWLKGRGSVTVREER